MDYKAQIRLVCLAAAGGATPKRCLGTLALLGRWRQRPWGCLIGMLVLGSGARGGPAVPNVRENVRIDAG